MKSDLRSAIKILSRVDMVEPLKLGKAQGIVIMNFIKGAWIFSGRIGKGVLFKRVESGWSNPSSVALLGAGVGWQFGLEREQIAILLWSKAAVEVFERTGQLQIGAEFGSAIGPVGANVGGGVAGNHKGLCAISAFSFTQGVFFGFSLEGSMLLKNSIENRRFYENKWASGKRIRAGTMKVPTDKKLWLISSIHNILDNLSDGRRPSDRPDRLSELFAEAKAKNDILETAIQPQAYDTSEEGSLKLPPVGKVHSKPKSLIKEQSSQNVSL